MEKPTEILKEFINELTGEGIVFGETKLVKLLYLLEVEYFRQFRERLTDLNWTYYKYGPYAFEIEGILSKFPFVKDEYTFDISKKFKEFKIDGYDKTDLDELVKVLIKNLIRKWGIEDLNDLLDYVYFETEPMKDAKKNKVLDFSLIKEKEAFKYKKFTLDQEIIKGIHQKLKEKKLRIERLKKDFKDQRSFKEFYSDMLSNKGNIGINGECKFGE